MINLESGEVLSVNYDGDRSIRVKLLNDIGSVVDEESSTVITAFPSKRNQHLSPLKGEIVLLCTAPSPSASSNKNQLQYYYIDVLGIQNSVHHNSLPKVTTTNINNGEIPQNQQTANRQQVDTNFAENDNINSQLQPFPGDFLVEGRYGNSLRFGATPLNNNTSNYSDKLGQPITILRNTSIFKKNKIVEDFNMDESFVTLTSGQRLNFKASSTALKSAKNESGDTFNGDSFGNVPTILVSSGRLFFNSTIKEIVMSSNTNVTITAEKTVTVDSYKKVVLESPRIDLGDGATEPLILGNQWKIWMQELITALGSITVISPVGPCSPLIASAQWTLIEGIKAKMDLLLSEITFTKKLSIAIPSITTQQTDSNSYKINVVQIENLKTQKDELKQSENVEDLTIDEKTTYRDAYNATEQIIIEGEVLQSQTDTDVSIEQQDIYVFSGDVEEEDAIPLETFIDVEEEPLTDFTWDYEFLEPLTITKLNNTKNYSLVENKLDSASVNTGKKVVELALMDIGISDEPLGSNSGKIVDNYLSSINCRPGKAIWNIGAIVTWWQNAGLPTPLQNKSSVSVWYKWAKDTNRFSATPLPGSIVVYGTETDKVHAHSLAVYISEGVCVEVVDSFVTKTIPRSTAILGYIVPSLKDLQRPKISYKEDDDGSKLNSEAQFSPISIISNVARQEAIKQSLRNVFGSAVQQHGACARYTMNLAYNFIANYKNTFKISEGVKISAGGSANSTAFHSNLQKLGYTQQILGEKTKEELKAFIKLGKFNPGDVLTYRCTEGYLKSNPHMYGHAQIYTNLSPSGWACDQQDNYKTGFVYNSSTTKDAKFIVTYFSL